MPKKGFKKKVPSKTDSPDKVAAALNALEPGAALAAILKEVRDATAKLTELTNENADLREKLAANDREAGLVRVGGPDDDFVIPVPDDAVKEGAFALWRSPSPGQKVVLFRFPKDRHPNGDYEIVPPILAEFEKGVCTLTDEKQIEEMRSRERENMAKGVPIFVEITDKEQMALARKGQLHSRNIASNQGITPDSTMADVGL